MRGTQTKFKHMAARTYLRPRDMIMFGNCCLDEARKSATERITNHDVSQARPKYSEYLVSELDDEIHPVLENWKHFSTYYDGFIPFDSVAIRSWSVTTS